MWDEEVGCSLFARQICCTRVGAFGGWMGVRAMGGLVGCLGMLDVRCWMLDVGC